MTKSPSIHRLEADVIAKIAAGEVVQRPENACKELVENAIDAHATSIDVICRSGGLRSLQVTDNGCGIDSDNLPLLCERFTTSKITHADDLTRIQTFGFRGEALASISHISQPLTVITKTKDSPNAWQARYMDGKLLKLENNEDDIKKVAGNVGTTIIAENLFYNNPSRLQALSNYNEEFTRILEIMQKYSIEYYQIAFSCKKSGDRSFMLSTNLATTRIDVIRQVYGAHIASNLVELHSKSEKYHFEATGLYTNPNYNSKRFTFLLFINGRLVTSSRVRRNIESAFSFALAKGQHPFVYLSLRLDPQFVDVNVHPTKDEVIFYDEDEICTLITSDIQAGLSAFDSLRVLPLPNNISMNTPSQTKSPSTSSLTPHYYAPRTLVRTDPKDQKLTRSFPKLDKYVKAPIQESSSQKLLYPKARTNELQNPRSFSSHYPETPNTSSNLITPNTSSNPITPILSSSSSLEIPLVSSNSEISITPLTIQNPVEYRSVDLLSIKELRDEYVSKANAKASEILANHSFVGVVDFTRRLVAIQHETDLYLIDYGAACYEFFYQLGLLHFSNYGEISLEYELEALTLKDVFRAVCSKALQSMSELAQDQFLEEKSKMLIEKREMLLDLFKVGISESGQIEKMPILLQGYSVPWAKLPQFFADLLFTVDWTEELPCFQGILQALAKLHCPISLSAKDQSHETLEMIKLDLENIIFPAMRANYVASENLFINRQLLRVTSLPRLYSVFERC